MELMDTSMEHVQKIYKDMKQIIPEDAIGKVVVAVSYLSLVIMGLTF